MLTRPWSPFSEAAANLYSAGLCPVPCGGDDGKKPLVVTRNWKQRPNWKVVQGWLSGERFSSANIGILTGLSGITVIDIDDVEALDLILDLFGTTPLTVRTPSGGRHLWYRANGERSHNLRSKGLCADVKGTGGFLVAPPSVRIGGQSAGKPYCIETGSWADLPVLPPISSRGRAFLNGGHTSSSSLGELSKPFKTCPTSLPRGSRNNGMFRTCLRLAKGCENEEALITEALFYNKALCEPPLDEYEVAEIAKSAWIYEITGRNFYQEGGVYLSNNLKSRIGDPDALWLYTTLVGAHFEKQRSGKTFAIAPKAMTSAGVAAPLGVRGIRRACEILIKSGVIQRVHQGGSGPGDPHLYAFARIDNARGHVEHSDAPEP